MMIRAKPLIEHNLRLVSAYHQKYYFEAERDDLVSIGTIGLIKAVCQFSRSAASV